MLSRPLHLSPNNDMESLKNSPMNSHSNSSSSSKNRNGQRSSPQPLPPNSRNSSLSFSPASFPYSSLQQQQQAVSPFNSLQQQQAGSPYMHKQEKMFRGRLDLPPEENADLEELEKFAKMFKQKRIKLGKQRII